MSTAPATSRIRVKQGATWQASLAVSISGTAYTLTSRDTVAAQFRAIPHGTKLLTPVVTFSGGEAVLTCSAASTAALPITEDTAAYFDVEVTYAATPVTASSGVTDACLAQEVTLYAEVTK